MTILTWFLAGVALVNFLGAAAVYLRGSRDKGTIETLTRSNSALSENNVILNERVGVLEVEGRRYMEKLVDQSRTIEVLTNTVNSADLIAQLREDLSTHHIAAMAGQTEIHADLLTLPDRIATAIKEKP